MLEVTIKSKYNNEETADVKNNNINILENPRLCS